MASTRSWVPNPSSMTSHPPGPQHARARPPRGARKSRSPWARRRAPRAARSRAPRAAARPARIAARRAGSRPPGRRRRRPARTAGRRPPTARAPPVAARCPRATASAAGEMSVPHASAPVSSCRVTARAPEPHAGIHEASRARRQRQRGFDHVLGFGAGNQHVGRDPELAAVELLPSGDVLGGLALQALVQVAAVVQPLDPVTARARDGRRGRRARGRGRCASSTSAVSRGTATPASSSSRAPCEQRRAGRHLRGRAGAVLALLLQLFGLVMSGERVDDGLEPPSMTISSWCRVRPMRWSVTRFCGKL